MPVSQEEFLAASASTTLNLAEMDELITKSVALWEEYDAKKKVASEAYNAAEAHDAKILNALKSAGKTKYYVEKLGTMSITQKLSVNVPKAIEQKKKLFEYLRGIGEEFFYTMLTVNSNSLNAWHNQEFERAAEKGILGFSVPGIDQPTTRESLRFTKERGKA